MSDEASVVAQAKVNLLLRVLARESSGFHGIETIFLRLDLGDEVRVRIRASERSLDCAGPAMPADGLGDVERNLAYRAGVTYAEATGWPTGFEIEITKQIPVGGGLGGGSADAGAVLRILDALAPNPLGRRLVALAAALGSDVPFLTLDSPMALGWGRGERLMPLPVPPHRPIVLLMPRFGVSTAEAYAWLGIDRGSYLPRADVVDPALLTTWEGLVAVATNEFEPVVGSRHVEIPRAVEALRSHGAAIAMMSGSGSAVFGVFDTAPDMNRLASETGLRGVLTRSASRVVPVKRVE
jgi:4-diphosphocytidyl-2-C-methyl-D-erythritol kinase